MRHVTKTIVQGLKGLDRFLQSDRSRFAAAPILLITSKPDTQQGKSRKQVDEVCRQVEFLLQQKLGLRTVVSHPASGYVFPAISDIQSSLDMASRVGASTVAAVGSGSAIDLAKAVSQSGFDELLLIPATHGATFASATSHSLLLDPREEAILVEPPQKKAVTEIPTTITVMDRKHLDLRESKNVAFLVLSIALDLLYKGASVDDENVRHLINTSEWLINSSRDLASLSEDKMNDAHDKLMEVILQAGSLVSYGLGNDTRSIPIALAASLIPKTFPQHNTAEFIASLVPSLCRALAEKGATNELIDEMVSDTFDLVPRAITTESMDTILSQIHANQILWNSYDVLDKDFQTILKDHLLC